MGVKRNWISREAWADVKAGFAALDRSELLRFENLSVQSKGAARANRESVRGGSPQPPPLAECPPPPLAVVAVDDSARRFGYGLVPFEGACKRCSRHGEAGHASFSLDPLCLRERPMSEGAQGLVDQEERELPIDTTQLSELFDQKSRKTLESDFKKISSKPSLDRGAVPDTVKRFPHCGDLCATRAAPVVLDMQRRLRTELADLIRQLPKATKVSSHDVVLAFVTRHAGVVRCVIAEVAEVVMQSGANSAQQTYVLMDIVEPGGGVGGVLQGARLREQREDMVEQDSGLRTPFIAIVGALVHKVTDELTSDLVIVQGNDQRAVDRVEVHRLWVKQIAGACVEVVKVQERVVQVERPADGGVALQGGPAAAVDSDDDDDASFMRKRFRRGGRAGARRSGARIDPGPLPLQPPGEPYHPPDWIEAELGALLAELGEDFADLQAELDRNDPNLAHSASSESGESAGGNVDDVASAGAAEVAQAPPLAEACPWKEALTRLADSYEREAVLASLGVRITENWDLTTDEPHPKRLGGLYMSWGTTMSAGCVADAHRNCKCLVSIKKTDPLRLELDLVKWLCFGASEGCTVAKHLQAGYDLKIKHGMRPRGPRPDA